MTNVNDGKYVGPLTPEQVVKQFLFRIEIHETYDELVQEDLATWSGYGSHEFHQWAINGYEHGIKYIQENNPVVYRCSTGEAFATIFGFIIKLFGGKK